MSTCKRAHSRGNERLATVNRVQNVGLSALGVSGEIETSDIELLGEKGKGHVFAPGEPFRVRVRYVAREACANPVFGIGVYRSDGTYINGSNHHWREDPIQLGPLVAGDEGVVEMAFEKLPLLQGQYYLTTFLYDHAKASPTAIDHREHAAVFEVLDSGQMQHGMLYLPSRWRVQRGDGEVMESEG